jgi:cysteinyl-tRNA synthetase
MKSWCLSVWRSMTKKVHTPFQPRVHTNWLATDGKALAKLVPPSVLIKARDEKKALVAAKAAQKAAAKAAAQQQQLAKLEKGKLKPNEMFKPPHVPEGTYGSWDERGVPLTDDLGQELAKGRMKKLVKEWEEQERRHEAWLAHSAQQEKASGEPEGSAT